MANIKEKIEPNVLPFLIVSGSLGFYFTSYHSFILFHTLAELLTVVIAFGIFAIAWSSRHFISNNFLVIIGMAYFFVGSLDLVHALGYKGMEIFKGYGSNLPTQLWVAARYMEAFSFVAAFLFLKEKADEEDDAEAVVKKASIVFFIYFGIFIAVIISIFYLRIFPAAYIEGTGLTSFKKISEYIICLLFIVSIVLLFKKKKLLHHEMANLLSLALFLKIASEICFIEYVGVYDFSNMLGHIFKFISFLVLYKAVLEIGLMRPYHFLFLDLRKSQEKYRSAQAKLTKKIEEQLSDSYKYLGTINRKISLLLDIEKHSHKVRNKEEIVNYILASAMSVSRAELGLLYRLDSGNQVSLISGKTLSGGEVDNFQNFCPLEKERLKKIKTEAARASGPFDFSSEDFCGNGKKLTYFVALPIKKEKKCLGLMFLGFTDRKSMESQELEFLDVFAVHASSAVFRAEIVTEISKEVRVIKKGVLSIRSAGELKGA